MNPGSPSSRPDDGGEETPGEIAWMGTFRDAPVEQVNAPAPSSVQGVRPRRPGRVSLVLTAAAVVFAVGTSAYALVNKDPLPPVVVGAAENGGSERPVVDDSAEVNPAAVAPAAGGVAGGPTPVAPPARPASPVTPAAPPPRAATATAPTAPAVAGATPADPAPTPAPAPKPTPSAAKPAAKPPAQPTDPKPAAKPPAQPTDPKPGTSTKAKPTAKAKPKPKSAPAKPGSSAKQAWDQALADHQKRLDEAAKRHAQWRKKWQQQRQW